jgi:hypothetical protein
MSRIFQTAEMQAGNRPELAVCKGGRERPDRARQATSPGQGGGLRLGDAAIRRVCRRSKEALPRSEASRWAQEGLATRPGSFPKTPIFTYRVLVEVARIELSRQNCWALPQAAASPLGWQRAGEAGGARRWGYSRSQALHRARATGCGKFQSRVPRRDSTAPPTAWRTRIWSSSTTS